MQTLENFKQMHNLSKCIKFYAWTMRWKNFILLRLVSENCLEKNLADILSNTRILNKKQKLAFFGGGK